MESFQEVIDLFNFTIEDLLDEVMLELHQDIIELNQIEQLSEGIDALGQKIRTIRALEQGLGNVYSLYTIHERKAKGLQTENVDLNFSGTFWKSFKIVKVSSGWQVQVNYNVHGEDILENFDSKYDFTGLTDNNIEVLTYQYIMPLLEKKIKNRLKI